MEQYTEDNFWNYCLNALARPGASELVANGPGSFFVTHNGVKEKLKSPDMTVRSYTESIEKHLVPLVYAHTPFDPKGYLFEGHYTAKSRNSKFEGRCHIVLPPATTSPRVTLTKISESTNTIESIAESGSMSTEMMNFITSAVKAKFTIVLSGQSGAGKTTTLQALTKFFDSQDRLGVGEDLPELKLSQENSFYLHSVPWKPGFDPNKVADLSWVVKQFLRMRPDRVIIGETRGKEFADFLVATNSGMPGSMTTLHANDPVSALDKMTRFALQGSERQPIRSINKEIGSAIDLIIQLGRINGKHRVTHIEEIVGTVGAGDDAQLTTSTLYEYDVANDNWVKSAMPSDKMQVRFGLANINIKPFLSVPVGSVLSPHRRSSGLETMNQGGSFGDTGNPFASGRRV